MPRRRRRSTRVREIVDLWVDLFAEHDLLNFATAMAYRAFVSLVPLVLLGVAILGSIGRQDIWNDQVAPQLESRLRLPVFAGIDDVVQQIFARNSPGLIVFATLLAIWYASGGVRAVMGALTRIEDSEETRPWWIRFPVSFALAVVLNVTVAGALLLLLATKNSVHGAWAVPFGIFRWLAAIVLLGLGFGVLVRFAPAERRPKKWASAGAALVIVAWIVQSLIFRWYVTSIANFKSAIGSLTVLLVLTSYLYIASVVLLVGIQLDELVRRDESGDDQRGIVALVRGLF
jgi:membrane protein